MGALPFGGWRHRARPADGPHLCENQLAIFRDMRLCLWRYGRTIDVEEGIEVQDKGVRDLAPRRRAVECELCLEVKLAGGDARDIDVLYIMFLHYCQVRMRESRIFTFTMTASVTMLSEGTTSAIASS